MGCHLPQYTATFVHKPDYKRSGCSGKQSQEEEGQVSIVASHHLVPIAVELFGVCRTAVQIFLQDLSRCLKYSTLKPESHHHLIQRISMTLQRGSMAVILGTSDPGPPSVPFFPT